MLPSNTEFTKAEISFVAATPTTLYHLRVVDGNAGSDTVYVDEGYLGANDNIGSVDLAEKQYSQTEGHFTVTGTNWTTGRAVCIPYATRNNGAYRLRCNIKGTLSAGTPTFVGTISGITFKTGQNQAITADLNTGTSEQHPNYINLAVGGGGTFRVTTTTGSFDEIKISFDVELDSKPTWTTDFPSEQVVRAENANGFSYARWNGIAGCSFSANTGSMTTLTNSNCNTATTIFNATSGNDNLEITKANLKAESWYKVIFSGTLYTQYAGSTTQCDYAISDGTSELVNTFKVSDTTLGSTNSGETVIGFVKYSSLQASKTFSLKAKVVTGSGSCVCLASSGYGCSLSVEEVYPTQAMPQIVNSVVTSDQNQTSLAAAATNGICTSGTCSLLTKQGGVSSITFNSTGNYNVNFTAGTFTSAPTCTCTIFNIGFSERCIIQPSPSTSVLNILVRDGAGAQVNDQFSIMCIGSK